MKASTILCKKYLSLGWIVLGFVSCTFFDDTPIPILTRYDFPPEVLDSIFTKEIPKEIRNVDDFLDKIIHNGMAIHEGSDPPEIYDLEGGAFIVENDCIFDEKTPANVDSLYGKYKETVRIFRDQRNSFMADISYSSLGNDNYPQYPAGLDRGSGTGYVSGSGNNYTIFYKVDNGNFDKIPYKALWILSGSVSTPPYVLEISNVTKCMVMFEKGADPEDKVANRGTLRIFRDANAEWTQL